MHKIKSKNKIKLLLTKQANNAILIILTYVIYHNLGDREQSFYQNTQMNKNSSKN